MLFCGEWSPNYIRNEFDILTFANKYTVSLCRLMSTENTLLQTREEEGVTYERTLVASEFIDWLLQEGEMPTREETERLGRRLLEHGIIQHGEHMDKIYEQYHE